MRTDPSVVLNYVPYTRKVHINS